MSVDLLLDTHGVIWLAFGDPRGRRLVGEALTDDASTVSVSMATWIEVAIKHATGKLDVNVADLRRNALAHGMLELQITASHAVALESLPLHHRDPFDRLLVAQALAEDMTLATVDPAFAPYEGLAVTGL